MCYKTCITVVVFAALAVTATVQAESVSMLLEKGIYTEETVGDLDAAIKIYEQIVDEAQASRSYVAQAHYRLGMCYLKKGKNEEATAAFQRLIDQFPKQTELVAQARARLSALGQPGPEAVLRQITDSFGSWTSGTLSRNGKYICDVDWETGDLVVYELASGKTRPLTKKGSWDASNDYAWFSAISPDSKQVAYGWRNEELGICELHLIGMDGSEHRVLLSNKEISWLQPVQWSPDGKHILARFTTREANNLIVWVSVADGSVKVLKEVGKWWPGDWERRERWGVTACHSPDGRYIAYDLPQEGDRKTWDIFLFDIHENREIPFVKHPADDRLFGWSPDGKCILFGSDRAQSWDAWMVRVSDGIPQGLDEPVMHGMARIHPKGFAPDGSFYGTMGYYVREVYIATLDFETGKLLDRPKAMPLKAYKKAGGEWSHDGQYLAFNAYMREDEPVILCLYSVQTREVRKISPKNLVRFGHLRWSPDDRYIFARGQEKKGDPYGVYKIDVETGEAAELVKGATGISPRVVDCSPDGKRIFYTVSREADTKATRIVVKDLESRSENELYSDPHLNYRWLAISPDGKWLAFSTYDLETRTAALNIIPSDGGERRRVVSLRESKTSTIRGIDWMPDARDLLFLREDDPGVSLWKVSLEGGSPQKLWHPKKLVMMYPRVHPDGRRIAFTSLRYREGLWVMENFLPELAAAE